MSTTAIRLPFDILLLIFECTAVHRVFKSEGLDKRSLEAWPSTNSTTLVNAALVCRDWTKPALTILYRNILIHSESVNGLQTSLERSLVNRSYIRCLSINSSAIREIIQLLYLVNRSLQGLQLLLLPSNTRVIARFLRLHTLVIGASGQKPLMLHLPSSLLHLQITTRFKMNLDINESSHRIHLFGTFNLTTLALSTSAEGTAAFSKLYLRLRRLSIYFCVAIQLEIDSPLETAHLLPNFKSLEVLSVSARGIDLTLFNYLPPTLLYIQIVELYAGVSLEDVLRPLRDRNVNSKLEKVVLAYAAKYREANDVEVDQDFLESRNLILDIIEEGIPVKEFFRLYE